MEKEIPPIESPESTDPVEPTEALPAAPLPSVFYRAKLDADRVYWGWEQVAALAEGDVEVPKDCDLKTGHYRHNDMAEPEPRFEPLNREQKRDAPDAPSMERALYGLIQSQGATAPAYSLQWARWYETTIDAHAAAVKVGIDRGNKS